MTPSLADLVALATQYYPRPGNPDLHSPTEWDAKIIAAPETRALEARRAEAYQNLSHWRQLLDALRSQLPGVRVSDRTLPGIYCDAAYTAVLEIVAPVEGVQSLEVPVYASILTPLYLAYELRRAVHAGRYEPQTRSFTPSATTAHVFAAIERAMHTRGYLRFPEEWADIVVPAIVCENLLPGTVTLADALFSESRL